MDKPTAFNFKYPFLPVVGNKPVPSLNMSKEKPKPNKPPGKPTASATAPANEPAARKTVVLPPAAADSAGGVAAERGPLFRRIDWITFAVSTLLTLVVYLITLAPDLTLEDSGELAVGSYYAAVPHAPGYPIWTIYSWLFTVLIPFSNVAFRVAVSSAVAAALANGLLGLIVSRGSSMLIESIDDLKALDRKWESALCIVSGFVAAAMIGFNGFMWSQAIIVEVYTLSVLSFMGVLVCLLHWTYNAEQRRYLYIAAFLFGICFNNHQTLIVAAMGIEVLIAVVRPSLGRNAFLVNTIFYVLGLIAKSQGALTAFDQNGPLYAVFNGVGLLSLAAFVYLAWQTKRLRDEWTPVTWTFLAWVVGAAFYFYMPITSATNPPMNWGYPRTWDGFIHAFTRGQYEKTNPTDIFNDPLRFLTQVRMYFESTADEFHPVFLLIALVPFFLYMRMQKRERAWLLGNFAIYLCLAFLLLILLNPTPDRQSRDQTKVFFTASHLTIAMFLGFGLTLSGAMLIRHYQRVRLLALSCGAAAVAIALYSLAARVELFHAVPGAPAGLGVFWSGLRATFTHLYFTPPVLSILARLFVLVLVGAFVVVILLQRERLATGVLLVFFTAIPLYSPLSHWAENEQRGHLFGFWFGHDMFAPPFGIYPPMEKNTVLFGGTDPGRFCPTYMIFCESFIAPQNRRDPEFDRRDVYIITQNALADGTYLNYIRAHYNRSTQIDPPFLRDMVLNAQNVALGKKELERKGRGEWHRTNWVAKSIGSLTNLVRPFDDVLLAFGKRVEERRRREEVYPPKEIYQPTPEDLGRCYNEYIMDAARRRMHDDQNPNEPRQTRPGENIMILPDGRATVSGQVAVMAINALLTKVIFDQNPTNEFYVEESFPLEWMYPHLTPYGIIMKINRQPVPVLTEDVVRKDHDFWTKYTERLCGNWISYETPVQEICDYATRVYLHGDLTGYRGDPRFVRDNDAQKAFSKLRNSIAGMYAWRLGPDCPANLRPQTPADRERVLREAEFAFKQAYAFCPYSPETLSRYVSLLAAVGRFDDALLLAKTSMRFDEEGSFAYALADQLERMKKSMATVNQTQDNLGKLESAYREKPTNARAAFDLVSAYIMVGRSNEAYRVLDELVGSTNVDAGTLLSVARAYVELGTYARSEPALRKLVTLMPQNPELWYDLAGAQAGMNNRTSAVESLRMALQLSAQRRAADPGATNLQTVAVADARFLPLHGTPEFQALVAPK